MYIYICCTRYRYARCVIAIETCASWNMGPWEATWHGKLNRTRSLSRFCRVLVYTLTNDVSIVSRINISYIVPATCSFFTVKRVLRTHALFIKREYTEMKFSRISDANYVSLWLCSEMINVARSKSGQPICRMTRYKFEIYFLPADREIM